jgi:NAD(P)-dependent dehydrogenase (short-subunit alcohol dehydrogenase family)
MADPGVFRDGLLAGQVGVVTGGGTGIGFGIATLLAQLGMHVVLASRRAEHTKPAAERLRALGGCESTPVFDVRDADRVRAVLDGVAAEYGRLDLLVNNAAGNFYVPSESMSPNAWRSVIEIDLFGTFFCSQAALPHMRAAGGGAIVNISMTLHYRGWPMMAHATAAKGGIDALTRTLALEWAPYGVRVNAVAPGPVPTEGVLKAFTRPAASGTDLFDAFSRPGEAAPPEAGRAPGEAATAASGETRRVTGTDAVDAIEARARMIPLGRWGTPRDIANAVAFLASPAASWITGTILVVDGGEWLARPPA